MDKGIDFIPGKFWLVLLQLIHIFSILVTPGYDL